ncbi:MAG: VWA domain-containing protein [Schleiferiaceae bacterium]|nr:VWA domain-containing protein [Schleiferiaceae bacterium]
MFNLSFHNPEFLWAFVVLVPALLFYIWRYWQQKPFLTLSGTFAIERSSSNWKRYLVGLPALLRFTGLGLLIIALARPRTSETSTKLKSQEGVDIVMSMDVSGSMLARDLKPNRLEALKKVAEAFVAQRPNDRFGLVVYAGEAYTLSPITSDHAVVKNRIRELQHGVVEDGTAIGVGLGTAINRLRNSIAKSKVIILLTDGENNTGSIDPLTAAELARSFGIKVYTVGVGTIGMAEFPVARDFSGNLIYQNIEVKIDEELMKQIAEITQGKYFRATDNKKLEEIYQEIDQLERSELEELRFYDYQELFYAWAFAAFFVFALEFLMRRIMLKSFL